MTQIEAHKMTMEVAEFAELATNGKAAYMVIIVGEVDGKGAVLIETNINPDLADEISPVVNRALKS